MHWMRCLFLLLLASLWCHPSSSTAAPTHKAGDSIYVLHIQHFHNSTTDTAAPSSSQQETFAEEAAVVPLPDGLVLVRAPCSYVLDFDKQHTPAAAQVTWLLLLPLCRCTCTSPSKQRAGVTAPPFPKQSASWQQRSHSSQWSCP